ncbi:MAG: hypothetical protein HC910_22575 [Spirulinaceae cyanobacterium SM2_1_0]|nr:hypothetical protein [Spirulinaceae cyanobacterium SM2_1_0]
MNSAFQTVMGWLTDGKVFQGLMVAGLIKLVSLGFGLQEQSLQTQQRLTVISQDLAVLQKDVDQLNRVSAANQVHTEYFLARLDKLEQKR